MTKKKTPSSIQDTLAERSHTHGEFEDHARATQAIKATMHEEMNWEDLSDIQKEALDMIAHKIGRVLTGNPDHKDHWHDIAGYAKLVEDRI